MRLIIKPIKLQTYQVWYPRNAFFSANEDFGINPSNKLLVQRAGKKGACKKTVTDVVFLPPSLSFSV